MSEVGDAARAAADRSGTLVRRLVLSSVVSGAYAVAWAVTDVTGNEAAHDALMIGGPVLLVVACAAGISWLFWFRDLYAAVQAAGRARQYTRNIGLWIWVVPFAGLILPKMLVNDVWRAADDPERLGASRPGVLQVWWALWVAVVVLPMEWFGVGTPPLLFGALAVEGILAVRVVRLLTGRVVLLAHRHAPDRAPVLA